MIARSREHRREPGDGDPFARAVLVVGEIDVAGRCARSSSLPLESLVTNHRSAPGARFWLAIARDDEMPVTATRGQHRRVELFNHRVERVEFFLFGHASRNASRGARVPRIPRNPWLASRENQDARDERQDRQGQGAIPVRQAPKCRTESARWREEQAEVALNQDRHRVTSQIRSRSARAAELQLHGAPP